MSLLMESMMRFPLFWLETCQAHTHARISYVHAGYHSVSNSDSVQIPHSCNIILMQFSPLPVIRVGEHDRLRCMGCRPVRASER